MLLHGKWAVVVSWKGVNCQTKSKCSQSRNSRNSADNWTNAHVNLCVCVCLRGSCCCQKRQITQGEDTMHTLVHTHTHSHLYMESISKIQDVNSDNNKLWDSLPGKQRITIKCKDQLGKFISQNYSANNNKAPSGKREWEGRREQRQRSGSSRVPRFIWTRQGRRTHVGMLIVTCSSCLFSASLAKSLTDGRQGRRRAHTVRAKSIWQVDFWLAIYDTVTIKRFSEDPHVLSVFSPQSQSLSEPQPQPRPKSLSQFRLRRKGSWRFISAWQVLASP